MLARIEAAVFSKLGLVGFWLLSLGFAFWFGGHQTQERTTAVTAAVSSVTTQVGKILTDNINQQVGGINARLMGDTNAIQLILKGGFKANDDARDSLANLPHAGVYVKSSSAPPAQAGAVGPARTGPGNDETYRAELSDQAKGFFAGEANRADTCAVRLTAAQATLLSWSRAVMEYNSTVARPNGVKPLVLPTGKTE